MSLFPDSVYTSTNSWPFQEARKVLEANKTKDVVIFETGYGPSGLPHMGTFGEVVRTAMVRHAFSCLAHSPSELYCFSDDMDGLRKVPDNIPNPKALEPFLNRPLTCVPDPFGEFDSFAAHNNHRLRMFLDAMNIQYKFFSSTACYQAGMFDDMLLLVLQNHRAILDVMLPTLGPDRQRTYSPFLPISPSSGRVLQVAVQEYRQSTIVFRDEDGTLQEVPVTGGHCKLQWKVDWGMRWAALGIDYEMAGKDLIDSVKLARKICTILGGKPPEGMIAEHFIDEIGQKISKSKGNGLSVEEWKSYAPEESLAYMMYNTPGRAKRLFFDLIPRCVDEYLAHLQAYTHQSPQERLNNPVWHIHEGKPPLENICPLSFTLLLNVAGACQGSTPALLWRFVQRLYPETSPSTHPFLDRLIGYAVRYYQDRLAPQCHIAQPNDIERRALEAFERALSDLIAEKDDHKNSLARAGQGAQAAEQEGTRLTSGQEADRRGLSTVASCGSSRAHMLSGTRLAPQIARKELVRGS